MKVSASVVSLASWPSVRLMMLTTTLINPDVRKTSSNNFLWQNDLFQKHDVYRTVVKIKHVKKCQQWRYYRAFIFSFSSFIALANFTNVSSDATSREGQDLHLFCIASGRPDPNITWVRISPSGIMRDVLHRGTNWDFKNISRTEAGTYRCIANNGIEDPVSHTINVTVICEYKL